MKIRILCMLLCCAILLPILGCAKEEPPVSPSTASDSLPEQSEGATEGSESQQESEEGSETEVLSKTAQIFTETLYLFEGQKYDLNYQADHPSGEVEWKVSTDCAVVENGTVTAVKEGHAVISAGGEKVCSVKILSRTMPELYVFANGQKINSKEDYVPCQVSLTATNEDYTFLSEPAGIRLRGNSTAGVAKKPYRIKFDSKINLLGMNDGAKCKSWVLLAEWYDDSLIRNTLALSLAGSILDEYSSDWRYVKLILDGEDKGVYVLAEQSQINEHRMDIEEAGADTSALRSGYLFEVEGSKVDNGKFFVSYENLGITTFLGNPYNVQSTDVQEDGKRRWGYFLELKNDDVSEAQKEFANKYAQNIFKLIYEATYKDTYYAMDSALNLHRQNSMTAEEAICTVVDIDSMARMYVYLEMVCNFDAFKKSSFFYVDFSEGGTGKLTFASPWDHDRAFVKDWSAIEHEEYNEYYTAEKSVLYVMMMNHEWFREKVAEVWEEVKTESESFKNAIEIIRDASVIYEKEFKNDGYLWDRKNVQSEWATETCNWLEERIHWLDVQFSGMKAD